MIALVGEEEIREQVGALFARRQAELVELQSEARGEHVGSTAAAESVTKGELDICVIVAAEEFEPASRALRRALPRPPARELVRRPSPASRLRPRTGSRSASSSSPPAAPTGATSSIGADRLRAHPGLRARHDESKRRHQADDMDAYRAAKERLILGLR